MNAKELIALNNEKREQLHAGNFALYEEMLVYIRTNFNKSEQHTEEVLMELLDHLLQAQEEGKSAEEVFGDDPESYCKELIGELPKEPKKKQVSFITYIILNYLGIIGLTTGILLLVLYYVFNLGTNTISVSVGKGLVSLLFYIFLLFVFLLVIFKWVKGSSFKKKQPKKWVEFLFLWVLFMIFIGLYVFVPKLIPDFGSALTIPIYWLAIIGAILYGFSCLIRRKDSTT